MHDANGRRPAEAVRGFFVVARVALLAASVAAAGCSSRRPPRAPIPRATATEALGVGDEIQVRVEGEEADVATRYRLPPDGTIEPRGCPRLLAAGKTPDALTIELRACLARSRVEPALRITVLSHERWVVVFGQVHKPGRAPFAHARTITEAIVYSGGFTPTAWTGNVRLQRTIQGRRAAFSVDVARILEGDEPDLELDEGDWVFVPERIF
jgi:protein involved in polysaccharide export with SLBB domain